jgi:hypothetical protein
MKIFKFILGSILLMSLTSCATIISGSTQTITFSSDIDSVSVYVNDNYVGLLQNKNEDNIVDLEQNRKFPSRYANRPSLPVTLKRKSKYQLEFRKDGYKSLILRTSRNLNAGFLVLDIVTGVVPLIFDAMSGAWYELDVPSTHIILEEVQ